MEEAVPYRVTYVKCSDLPKLRSSGYVFQRHYYAVLSIGANTNASYELSALANEATTTFNASPSDALLIKLFVKRAAHGDIEVARAMVAFESIANDLEFEVKLTLSDEPKLLKTKLIKAKDIKEPVLVFKVTDISPRVNVVNLVPGPLPDRMRDTRIIVGITYVKTLNLPDIPKLKLGIEGPPRRVYAILTIENVSHELPSLEQCLPWPLTFSCKASAGLEIKLFAKRTKHADVLLGHALLNLASARSDEEIKVPLVPTADPTLANVAVVLKISSSARYRSNPAVVESTKASLEVNPKLVKSIGSINTLIKIGAAVAELNPIAKVVVGLVGVAADEFSKYLERNTPVLELLAEVGRASLFMADWDDPELDSHRPNQQRIFNSLLAEVNQCLQLAWALSEGKTDYGSIEDVETHGRELAGLLKHMKSNQMLDTQVAVIATQKTLAKVFKRVADLHDDKLLKELPIAQDVGPFASKACFEGTRVYLLQLITDWIIEPDGRQTLLLHGSAGKGKSAVLSRIARDLEKQGIAFLPFFAFNRNMADRSLSQLIPTWAEYLATWVPGYLEYLGGLASKQRQSSDPVEQREALLADALPKIKTAVPIVLLIDALDECPINAQGELWRTLDELRKLASPHSAIRFLFTSRPDGGVLDQFSDSDTIKVSIDQEEGTVADIRIFVTQKLSRNRKVAYLGEEIVSAAQGVFECAAVLCRQLTDPGPASFERRQNLIQALKEGRVNSLYDTYLQVLGQFQADPILMSTFRHVMAWIYSVRSPQPRNTFIQLGAVLIPNGAENVKTILDWLGSLLMGVGASDRISVSPFHTSLRDFLTDPAHCGEFVVDLGPRSQEDLALACFHLMNRDLKFNICRLPSSFLLNSEVEDLGALVERYMRSELKYACVSAGYHLNKLVSNHDRFHGPVTLVGNEQAIAEALQGFLDAKFLFWLEACSCMGIQQDGPGSDLPIFLTWAQSLGSEHHSLQAVLEDFIKFERRFREGYRLSAPQVYYSGLAFAPRLSLVAQKYTSQFQFIPTITHDREEHWPPSETLVIRESSYIHSIALSPDDRFIAAGRSDNADIQIWSAETGHPVGAALKGHQDSVNSVVFLGDGRLVSGSDDGSIIIWDMVGRRQVGEALVGEGGAVHCVAVSGNGQYLAAGLIDYTVHVWNIADSEERTCTYHGTLRGHASWSDWSNGIKRVSFSSDGAHIASCAFGDRTVRVWDVANLTQVAQLDTQAKYDVKSVAFSMNGHDIIVGHDDRIQVWDWASGQKIGDPLKGPDVYSIAVATDGQWIVSGSYNATVQILDLPSGQQIGESLVGHDGVVTSVAISKDGKRVVSAGDETIRIWDTGVISESRSKSPLAGHDGQPVVSISISPDGQYIASGSWDKTIRIWDVAGRRQDGEPLTGQYAVTSVAFSPNGRLIISGSADSTVRIWDVATRRQVGEPLRGHQDCVYSVAFSADGQRIVSGSEDKTIRVWETSSQKQIGQPLTGHEDYINSVAFSPCGQYFVSLSHDGTIMVWSGDVTTGMHQGEVPKHQHSMATSFVFSPDGSNLIAGYRDCIIRVWDVASRPQIAQIGDPLELDLDYANTFAVSSDGQHIALAYHHADIRVWDATSRKEIGGTLTGHEATITSVAFLDLPAGLHIVSGSEDATIRVWKAPSVPVPGMPSSPRHNLDMREGWFTVAAESTSQAVEFSRRALWIPYAFRQFSIAWNDCPIVFSAKPTITISFDVEQCAWGDNWEQIHKGSRAHLNVFCTPVSGELGSPGGDCHIFWRCA
ncbi:hypothetical protein HGRIS_005861 [Hohenbuehelia grisea]|uniref:NACHT domain-containing protein n=1 Tax=Hohenbuehelia grisea TaxID=104357 RepID=A0ABR3JY28_9AGAR